MMKRSPPAIRGYKSCGRNWQFAWANLRHKCRYPTLPRDKPAGVNSSGRIRGIDRRTAVDWPGQTDRAATMLHKTNGRFGLPRPLSLDEFSEKRRFS